MDEDLEEIYRQVSDHISAEEFESRIREKVSLMAGLCDPKTAGMLVARELGASEVLTKIGKIRPEIGMATFIGRILSISDIHEFVRSDGTVGRVGNLIIGDETGSVRLALWDETSDLIKSGDLKVDQCVKVRGLVKEGYAGMEVSLGRNGNIEEVDLDIKPRADPFKIEEIRSDMGDVNLAALILDDGESREFVRKDGSKGLVRTVLLGDETGKIRLTLWNERARIPLTKGETWEIINASSRERYGQVEIQAGNYTVLRKSNRIVNFSEKIVPIAELEAGMLCSVSGFVTGLGEVREFLREDGKKGKVANIYISDDTGRIKVVLWGDHVLLLEGLDLGHRADLMDCQIKNGWNEELEISCGWRTKITFTSPE